MFIIVTAIVAAWLLFGVAGYFMMRQGFYVMFEKSLGRDGAWCKRLRTQSKYIILTGPCFFIAALCCNGMDCFRKSQKQNTDSPSAY